ncbi:MAG TPA: hypothetical protein VJ697_12300 [Nitrososphaeraceae archaeon]|nr:hypothetical protein [Nitrososphaeraceae archaeon]
MLSTLIKKFIKKDKEIYDNNKIALSKFKNTDTNTKIWKYINKAQTLYKNKLQKVMLFILVASTLVIQSIHINNGQMAFAYHQQYNLPLPSELEHQPSYAIRIPFGIGQTDYSVGYDPSQVSIPAGMSIAWFNDDSNPHTVTTISSAPEQFDSGIIPPSGFSVMTFTKPGLYVYYDKMNPSIMGSIIVGDLVQLGKNMEMRIGENMPFDLTELGRVVLSFIPHKITLPPPLDMTYNITIYNGTMDNAIYNREFGDIDGILDLEIIPVQGIKGVPEQIKQANMTNNITNEGGEGNITTFAKQGFEKIDSNNTKNASAMLSNISSLPLSKSTIKTTTYGPDLSAPITGTYHIEGPIFIEPTDYIIKVELISIDGKNLSNPIEDVFLLPAKL